MSTKTSTKHTPGPWTVKRSARNGFPWVVCDNGLQPSDIMLGVPEVEANARLIAAAPDLLAALRSVLTLVDGGFKVGPKTHVVEDIRAAIAKAEGGQS